MSAAEIPAAVTAEKPPPLIVIKPPRLVPAIVLVAGYWAAWLYAHLLAPNVFARFLTLFWSPMVLAAGLLLWWLFASRMRWLDRVWGVLSLAIGAVLAYLVVDESMVMGLLMDAFPLVVTAAVLWLGIGQMLTPWTLRIGLVAVSLLGWGYFTLIRLDGVDGNLTSTRSWRWSETAEDKYLNEQPQATSNAASQPPVSAEPLVATAADWPEFRGPARDSRISGVRIVPDWNAHPPKLLWKKSIGPGWSSFAVIGNHVFTQEQRGELEAVVCLALDTGVEIWRHEDKLRFADVISGNGPRATPTFDSGRLYTFGAKGLLNCLDAATGQVIWSANAEKDSAAKTPMWGYSGSPLVAQGVVTVFCGGPDGKAVLGYDAATGQLRWSAGQGKHSFSSPQRWTIDGSEQVLLASEHGLEAFDPATGKLLWEHLWKSEAFRVTQPHILGDRQVLIGTSMTDGTRLLTLAQDGPKWVATEVWTTMDMKPYFNDFVTHEGFAYGFDGPIFLCIDLATGKKSLEARPLWPRAGAAARRPGADDRDLRNGRSGAARNEPETARRARQVSGARRQNLEPSRLLPRQAALPQQRRDCLLRAGAGIGVSRF